MANIAHLFYLNLKLKEVLTLDMVENSTNPVLAT
jgi:hypothetical protein